MDHAITVRDLLWPVLSIAGLIGGFAFLMFIVWLFNPFRSGH